MVDFKGLYSLPPKVIAGMKENLISSIVPAETSVRPAPVKRERGDKLYFVIFTTIAETKAMKEGKVCIPQVALNFPNFLDDRYAAPCPFKAESKPGAPETNPMSRLEPFVKEEADGRFISECFSSWILHHQLNLRMPVSALETLLAGTFFLGHDASSFDLSALDLIVRGMDIRDCDFRMQANGRAGHTLHFFVVQMTQNSMEKKIFLSISVAAFRVVSTLGKNVTLEVPGPKDQQSHLAILIRDNSSDFSNPFERRAQPLPPFDGPNDLRRMTTAQLGQWMMNRMPDPRQAGTDVEMLWDSRDQGQMIDLRPYRSRNRAKPYGIPTSFFSQPGNTAFAHPRLKIKELASTWRIFGSKSGKILSLAQPNSWIRDFIREGFPPPNAPFPRRIPPNERLWETTFQEGLNNHGAHLGNGEAIAMHPQTYNRVDVGNPPVERYVVGQGPQHPDGLNLMKNTIDGVMQNSHQSTVDWYPDYLYIPAREDENAIRALQTPSGRTLFEYDPNFPIGNGETTRMGMLLLEDGGPRGPQKTDGTYQPGPGGPFFFDFKICTAIIPMSLALRNCNSFKIIVVTSIKYFASNFLFSYSSPRHLLKLSLRLRFSRQIRSVRRKPRETNRNAWKRLSSHVIATTPVFYLDRMLAGVADVSLRSDKQTLAHMFRESIDLDFEDAPFSEGKCEAFGSTKAMGN
ncbi:uncharacterized protein BDR25DRAFT_355497 [Lindgomyces ingoldianus]|uniref:Uncharacterized protein n=1 Tax=Lindgomyces ingoldianus TaxID=673940 RepID=A0ACB6QTX7_9PLEO|nr:uncharacterized protein BDR25DRAFT_355497 [Lindgomyces ingoldianus]KAF2470386.1 hypothetical protein BDR25DRAFT_355497 [Lindgomyces ingoldianus]